tara:strand:- start:1223 stop:1639 length:417 start_codon:yes stop_codon:yes gene_type:complete
MTLSGAKIKQAALDALFPDSLFNKKDLTTGTVNLETIENDISDRVDEYEKALDNIIPDRPAIPSLGSLIAKIPTIERPSPAEIRKFINDKLEEKRRQLQEQLINRLVSEATKEELPFTARRELSNLIARQNSRGKNYG